MSPYTVINLEVFNVNFTKDNFSEKTIINYSANSNITFIKLHLK